MKKLIFAIIILSPFAGISQPIVDIGAGASKSSYFGALKIGYIAGDKDGNMYGLQESVQLVKSDKMTLVNAQFGYNAWLGERFRMGWTGGMGWLNHNPIKGSKYDASVPGYKGVVPIISASFDYHYSRIGAISLSGFSALRVHGVSLSLKCYIDK